MESLLEGTSSFVSHEEEFELIRRFLHSLDAELGQSQISPSLFQDSSDTSQILETLVQNVYVRENYITVLESIINHLLDKFTMLSDERARLQETQGQEIERLKESLETMRKKAFDLESAYQREAKAKNELFGELGRLDERSNQVRELFMKAKVEIEDYKDVLGYYHEIEESLGKTKEILRCFQEENGSLRLRNDALKESLEEVQTELLENKRAHNASMSLQEELKQENERLRRAHKTLSRDFETLVIENQKINERNLELRVNATGIRNFSPRSFEEDPNDEFGTESRLLEHEKMLQTSIDGEVSRVKRPKSQQIDGQRLRLDLHKELLKKNLMKKGSLVLERISVSPVKEKRVCSAMKIPEKPLIWGRPEANFAEANLAEDQTKGIQIGEAKVEGRLERSESLLAEIMALKKNEIIDDVVFDAGFEKLDRLNTTWRPIISELEIQSSERIISRSQMNIEKSYKSLFHSKQMISSTTNEEKNEKRNMNSVFAMKNKKESEKGKEEDAAEYTGFLLEILVTFLQILT